MVLLSQVLCILWKGGGAHPALPWGPVPAARCLGDDYSEGLGSNPGFPTPSAHSGPLSPFHSLTDFLHILGTAGSQAVAPCRALRACPRSYAPVPEPNPRFRRWRRAFAPILFLLGLRRPFGLEGHARCQALCRIPKGKASGTVALPHRPGQQLPVSVWESPSHPPQLCSRSSTRALLRPWP